MASRADASSKMATPPSSPSADGQVDNVVVVSENQQDPPSDTSPASQSLDDDEPLRPEGHTSKSAATSAKLKAKVSVRFFQKLGHNIVNKVEDVGIGLLGVTDVIAEAGEGVGRTAVSGVGAVGSVVEEGVSGAFTIAKDRKTTLPREVDTITEVDVAGTILRDLNRAIEEQKMKGTNKSESPLNTPWILLVFPILPIAFMYTKTILDICLPPFLNAVYSIWTFFGWRFWFCLLLLILLGIVVAWDSVKAIGPLRSVTMQVDVAAIKLRRRAAHQASRQMPKIYKALDRIFPPITAVFVTLDQFLVPRLGYSPLLAINARINGWKFDPQIKEIRLESDDDPAHVGSFSDPNSPFAAVRRDNTDTPMHVEKRDRGHAIVMSEGGVVDQGGNGLEFDADRVSERVTPARQGAGDIFEQYFRIELRLHELSEVNRKYNSVWAEWSYRDMVVDRSVIRDITTSDKWKGFGTCFDDNTLSGEVRLPLRTHTSKVSGGFYDVPVKLVLKARNGLPIYCNDGARRYMRDSPPICIIGEIELSALRIGVGTDPTGVVRSELRIPLHAIGCDHYRSAILRASARISPVDNSSYSYRQLLSPLPNGEWTVRINIFELRNLHGVDDAGSSDPFVQASVMGMMKKTIQQRQTLSCMVNQLLFFSKLCTGLEFENEKVVVEVMDWNRFGSATKVGVYTLDAKRLLEMPGREIYRKWFALQDPNGGKRPPGFIKMSVTVVPPGSSPPHHQETEDAEEFSTAKLLKNSVLKTPSMSYENWAVHVTVGWADMLPRMSSRGYRDAIRGYVTFNYSGWPDCISNTFIAEAQDVVDPNIGTACRVLPQRRVIWNEEFILPLTVINGRVAQEGIHLKMYHKIMPRLQTPFRSDQLIGQVSVSFEELFKNNTTAIVRGDPADDEEEGDRIREVALMKPRYYNFYGMPDSAADPYDKGVAFRGRMLIGVAAKPGDIDKPFLRQCPPPPRPKLQFYKLNFCVLRATELPLDDSWDVSVKCRIGLYEFGHTIPFAEAQNFCAVWDENCVVSIPNLQFPEDVEQIPDLFVIIRGRKPKTAEELQNQVAEDVNENREKGGRVERDDRSSSDDAKWRPKAFLRLPAKHLICGQQEPRWLFMDYPGNDVLDSTKNQVPGSILMSASLSLYDPTQVKNNMVDDGASMSHISSGKPPTPLETTGALDNVDTEDEPRAANPSTTMVLDQPRGHAAASPIDEFDATTKANTYSYPLGAERSYTLRAMIWRGRDLPAADGSGLSDPVVIVSMGDQRVDGGVVCLQTVAPLWEEMVEVKDIKIRDGERKPNVNVLIYDYNGKNKKLDYLGRSIISCAQFDTVEPSLERSNWYPVFSVNPSVIVGEILADFQLVSSDRALMCPVRSIPPPRTSSALRVSLVGLRDVKFLQYAAGDMFVECSVSGESRFMKISKTGTILQQRAYEANCNILDVLLLDIKIPDDLRLAPALNMFAYANLQHLPEPTLVATACIPLEKWLSEYNRRLVTGETLIDDSFGTDAAVPKRLFESKNGYRFRRNAKRAGEDPIGAVSLRLHELKSQKRSDQKHLLEYQENRDVLRIGFSEKMAKKVLAHKDKEEEEAKEKERKKREKESRSIAKMIHAAFAPVRHLKYSIADKLADTMPDVATALGIEVEEDVSLTSMRASSDDEDGRIDYDGTMLFKKDRGFCPFELETDFSEPAYGEFLLFRGDNRALGNAIGRVEDVGQSVTGNQAFPPILPFDEVPTKATLEKREKRRAALEGARPAVGKVKARFDLIEMNAEDEVEARNVRMTSLRSFGCVFVPTEVVVRVYVLRALNLQQVGSRCNPYMTMRFYGGYPDFFSQKHDPVMNDDSPDFFCMFESRVKMPGGSVRIEVKDRVLPEVTVPLSYPMYIHEDGKHRLGLVQHDIPVNVGKLGFGWSEIIGETTIDLDARWYNSAWKSLSRTPVERRSLFSEESANLKGQLEVFVDIFDAKEVDKKPKMFRPVPISAPPQEEYEMRIVIYKISECTLPYKLANNDPSKVAAFYVQARLGNRQEDIRKTERCKYVADGVAEFNWRMKWSMKLPSLDVKPRLKLQVFDDTSHGFGDDQLCATADIKLRTLFDEICVNKKPIIKKRQWVVMEHPNYPDIQSRIQMSLELTTAEQAKKKKCLTGRGGWKKTQHEDYVLPVPFQPAAFSVYNPVPYFNYLIYSMVRNLQWTLATVLLIFPFIPMFVQFVFMLTPWQWYAAGGTCGLLVLIRISMVSAARTARMEREVEAAKEVAAVDEDQEPQ